MTNKTVSIRILLLFGLGGLTYLYSSASYSQVENCFEPIEAPLSEILDRESLDGWMSSNAFFTGGSKQSLVYYQPISDADFQTQQSVKYGVVGFIQPQLQASKRNISMNIPLEQPALLTGTIYVLRKGWFERFFMSKYSVSMELRVLDKTLILYPIFADGPIRTMVEQSRYF